jgi:hypothetical protein
LKWRAKVVRDIAVAIASSQCGPVVPSAVGTRKVQNAARVHQERLEPVRCAE